MLDAPDAFVLARLALAVGRHPLQPPVADHIRQQHIH
jgi:hypothetical protein